MLLKLIPTWAYFQPCIFNVSSLTAISRDWGLLLHELWNFIPPLVSGHKEIPPSSPSMATVPQDLDGKNCFQLTLICHFLFVQVACRDLSPSSHSRQHRATGPSSGSIPRPFPGQPRLQLAAHGTHVRLPRRRFLSQKRLEQQKGGKGFLRGFGRGGGGLRGLQGGPRGARRERDGARLEEARQISLHQNQHALRQREHRQSRRRRVARLRVQTQSNGSASLQLQRRMSQPDVDVRMSSGHVSGQRQMSKPTVSKAQLSRVADF